jgi:TRAP-type mannitol/chloroaromatic compound transport system substrate-binding protein
VLLCGVLFVLIECYNSCHKQKPRWFLREISMNQLRIVVIFPRIADVMIGCGYAIAERITSGRLQLTPKYAGIHINAVRSADITAQVEVEAKAKAEAEAELRDGDERRTKLKLM